MRKPTLIPLSQYQQKVQTNPLESLCNTKIICPHKNLNTCLWKTDTITLWLLSDYISGYISDTTDITFAYSLYPYVNFVYH